MWANASHKEAIHLLAVDGRVAAGGRVAAQGIGEGDVARRWGEYSKMCVELHLPIRTLDE